MKSLICTSTAVACTSMHEAGAYACSRMLAVDIRMASQSIFDVISISLGLPAES